MSGPGRLRGSATIGTVAEAIATDMRHKMAGFRSGKNPQDVRCLHDTAWQTADVDDITAVAECLRSDFVMQSPRTRAFEQASA